jgi:hypothetical protein
VGHLELWDLWRVGHLVMGCLVTGRFESGTFHDGMFCMCTEQYSSSQPSNETIFATSS